MTIRTVLTTGQRAALAMAAQGPLFRVARSYARQGSGRRFKADTIKTLIGRGLLERGASAKAAVPMITITTVGREALALPASATTPARRKPRRFDPTSDEARTSGHAPPDDTPAIRAWWLDQ